MSFKWPSWALGGIDLAAEQKRSDDANAQLAAMNKKALDSGLYNQDTYAQAEADRIKSYNDTGGANVSDSVDQAFVEGFDQGANNIKGVIKLPFDAAGHFVANAIPWQLWVVAGGALFLWLGGFGLLSGLKGVLKR